MARIAFIDTGSRQDDWLDFTVSACQAASRFDADLIVLMAGFEPNSSSHPGRDLVEVYNVLGKLADAPIAIVRGLKKQDVAYELLRKSPHGYQILDDYVWLLENWEPLDFRGIRMLAIGSDAEVPHYDGRFEKAHLANGRSKGRHREGSMDVLITHAPPSRIIRDSRTTWPDNQSLHLEIGVASVELLLKPKFHFYSDIHLGEAETRAGINAVPVDPRGELVILDTKTTMLFRVGVKVISWKLKRPQKRPGGLRSFERLSS